MEHAPVISFKTLGHIFRKCYIRIAFDGYLIVVIKNHKFIQFQMACQRSRFG